MKQQNKHRRFSETFKREKVNLIDERKLSVRDVSNIYEVSTTAVYKWVRKYSALSKGERVVVEKISESQKTRELHKRVRDLEQALGRKQMELDYYKEVVKLSSEEKGEDIKKKVTNQYPPKIGRY